MVEMNFNILGEGGSLWSVCENLVLSDIAQREIREVSYPT